MGNKFCLEMEKSALKHMLLYIAEGHLHFILLSTTQTQLFFRQNAHFKQVYL